MSTTNVSVSELNYDKYSTSKYDRDIVLSVPNHKELHSKIAKFLQKNFKRNGKYEVLELGVGTGITGAMIKSILPNSHFDLVDFSRQMMAGAKKKMGINNIRYIFGDYSKLKFNKKYSLVVSVIGIHHQTNPGKRRLFKKIYNLLEPGGYFIFGDLVTYKDQKRAALNHAKHYYELVKNATDERMLTEWAHHHMYLNLLAPVEDQIKWLKVAGFTVKLEMLSINTALLICKK